MTTLRRGDSVRYLGPDMEVLKHGTIGIVINVNRHDIFVEFPDSGVGAMDVAQLEVIV